MSKKVMLDTGFLITLFDQSRNYHLDAKKYFRHFLENDIECLVSTIVVAEYSVKQDFNTLPLSNFTILPFNYADANCCADLMDRYLKTLRPENVKRDAVKDDFKIIAQAHQIQADFLITEDDSSMVQFCRKLKGENAIQTKAVSVSKGFDISWINDDGQMEFSE